MKQTEKLLMIFSKQFGITQQKFTDHYSKGIGELNDEIYDGSNTKPEVPETKPS